jgi:hypothetical protein
MLNSKESHPYEYSQNRTIYISSSAESALLKE